MNTSLIKSALAMTAAFAVGSALATEEQIYGATFENTANGNYNDYGYTVGDSITNSAYYNAQDDAGWKAGSADDASQIIAGGATGTQALKLQTEGGTLTNVFSSTVRNKINAAREAENTKVVFEAQVKFVASDNLDCGVNPAEDHDAKFALYAYAPDGGSTTNLVIFHKDGSGTVTNDVISDITIDTEVYTPIVVKYYTTSGFSFFSVKAGDRQAISTNNAVELDDDGFIWFPTLNDGLHSDISSLCFKGTGEVDDISIKSVVEEPVVSDISFTFNLGTGVTGATVTIDGTPYDVTDATTNIAVAASLEGETATISAVTYSAWYIAADDAITSFTVADGDTFTVTAKQIAAADVTPDKTAEDFGFDSNGAFAGATGDDLIKAITWAETYNKTPAQMDALDFSQPLTISGDAKAYLLNVDPNDNAAIAAAETAAVAALEIASIEYDSVNDEWVIKSQNDKGDGDPLLNGHIAIFGATTVNGTYTDGTAGKSFFKAVLVK